MKGKRLYSALCALLLVAGIVVSIDQPVVATGIDPAVSDDAGGMVVSSEPPAGEAEMELATGDGETDTDVPTDPPVSAAGIDPTIGDDVGGLVVPADGVISAAGMDLTTRNDLRLTYKLEYRTTQGVYEEVPSNGHVFRHNRRYRITVEWKTDGDVKNGDYFTVPISIQPKVANANHSFTLYDINDGQTPIGKAVFNEVDMGDPNVSYYAFTAIFNDALEGQNNVRGSMAVEFEYNIVNDSGNSAHWNIGGDVFDGTHEGSGTGPFDTPHLYKDGRKDLDGVLGWYVVLNVNMLSRSQLETAMGVGPISSLRVVDNMSGGQSLYPVVESVLGYYDEFDVGVTHNEDISQGLYGPSDPDGDGKAYFKLYTVDVERAYASLRWDGLRLTDGRTLMSRQFLLPAYVQGQLNVDVARYIFLHCLYLPTNINYPANSSHEFIWPLDASFVQGITAEADGSGFAIDLDPDAVDGQMVLIYYYSEITDDTVTDFQNYATVEVNGDEKFSYKGELTDVTGSGGGGGNRNALVVNKVAEDGETPLEGARFSLSRECGCDPEAAEHNASFGPKITDVYGRARYSVDELGDYSADDIYILVEIEAPDDYERLVGEIRFTMDPNNKHAITPIGDWPDDVWLNDAGQITVRNEPKATPYKLQILKTDDQDTPQALENVRFELTFSGDAGYLASGITDSDGLVTLRLPDSPQGTYTLTETGGLAGYLPLGPVTFEVNGDIEVVAISDPRVTYDKTETSDQKNFLLKIHVVNETDPNPPPQLTIRKVDSADGTVLGGAVLQLENAQLSYTQSEITAAATGDAIFALPQNPAGLYTLTETTAPGGYVLLSEPVSLTLDADGAVTESSLPDMVYWDATGLVLMAKNEPVKNYTLSLRKVSSIDNTVLLRGAVFQLRKEGDDSFVPDDLITDANGEFTVALPQNPAGLYTLTETTAPGGYVLLSEPVSLTLDADGAVTESSLPDMVYWDADQLVLVAKNEPVKDYTLSLRKVSSSDNAALGGAVFQLRKQGDDSFMPDDLTTGANGEFTVLLPQDPAGVYTLEEIRAPIGYQALGSTITLEVDAGGAILSVQPDSLVAVDAANRAMLIVKNTPTDTDSGGSDSGGRRRPTPNGDNNTLVPNGSGYTEIGEDDVPLGQWVPEEDGSWTFIDVEPVPLTGNRAWNDLPLWLIVTAVATCGLKGLARRRRAN